MTKLTGLLLVAGRSSRFGGHKGLALMADGVPMAVRSALNLNEVVDNVLCVVREDDPGLQDTFEQYGLSFVKAIHADKGMSASLQAGIEASAEASGWVVALGDMPLIQPSTYSALVERFYEEEGIVVPVFERQVASHLSENVEQTRQGHPVIFSAHYREELLSLTGDTGARALLKRYKTKIHQVPVNDPGVFQDFDTQAEFSALLTDMKANCHSNSNESSFSP